MRAENVIWCISGSARDFHWLVNEPPTAMKPATRGRNTRSSYGKVTDGVWRTCLEHVAVVLRERDVGRGPGQPVGHQFESAGDRP